MANTTNFGWETPDDTDLVKDGALAMRTLGNAIDTSFVDLKGGTTGQNLRKNSNTDLDFTWAGDATNTVVDAEGDLLVGDSADTLQRLAIGTTGQVLTVDTTIDGKIKWAAAATGGGWTELASANLPTNSGTVTISTISADYRQLVLMLKDFHLATDGLNMLIRYNSDTGSNYSQIELTATGASTLTSSFYNASGHYVTGHGLDNTAGENLAILTLTDYANTTTYKVAEAVSFAKDDGGAYWGVSKYSSGWLNTAAISSITITNTGAPANFSAGSYILYGVK